MEKNQKKILENFIIEFLPPTESKRKYSGNELDYITRTLDKVLIQNFAFNLSKFEIADCFFELGYQIFYKNGVFDSTTKKIKLTNEDAGYFLILNCFTYFNISPKSMRQLMLTTSKLSEITNCRKIHNTEKMIIKIDLFKKKTIYSN
jgi:hypothetical protein